MTLWLKILNMSVTVMEGGHYGFGNQASTAQRRKGLTKAEIARRSGLSAPKVTQLFNGSTKDPRMSTVMMLCQAFEMTPSQLLDGVVIEQ